MLLHPRPCEAWNMQEGESQTTVLLPILEESDMRCVLSAQPAGAGEGAAGDEDDDEDDEEEAEVAVEEYEEDEDNDDDEEGDEARCHAAGDALSPRWCCGLQSAHLCLRGLLTIIPAAVEECIDGAGGGRGCWDCLPSGTGSESL